MYLKAEKLNKAVYQIGYHYRQISVIHYWLSDYQQNPTLVCNTTLSVLLFNQCWSNSDSTRISGDI